MDKDKPTTDLIALRRELHRHPEVSGQEEASAARILEALEGLPLEIRSGVAGHGIVADLTGGLNGPALAYRADMDALPINELNLLDFQSAYPGVMHACGHDVHMTIAVGLAHKLAAQRDELHGTVRFIFQPAEEAPTTEGSPVGAEAMVLEGVLEGLDAIWALHCAPTLYAQQLGFGQNAVFANSDTLTLEIEGRMAHGAYPHRGVNAILLGASLVNELTSLSSRVVDARETCVISFGTFQAGYAHNVIPDRAVLTGSMRTFDDSVRARALEAMERMASKLPAAHGGSATLTVQKSAAAVINHPVLQQRTIDILRRLVGSANVCSMPPMLGSEDFSEFGSRIPGCYLFLGTRQPDSNRVRELHTPEFDVDESCLSFAVETLSRLFFETGRLWTPLT